MRAFGDKVIIKPEVRTVTPGGIHVPEDIHADETLKRGTIVSVGEGKFDHGQYIPIGLFVNDRVLFHSNWSEPFTEDNEKYYATESDNVHVILN